MWIKFDETGTSPKLINTDNVSVITFDDEFLKFDLPSYQLKTIIKDNKQEDIYKLIAKSLRAGDSFLDLSYN